MNSNHRVGLYRWLIVAAALAIAAGAVAGQALTTWFNASLL